MNPAEGCTRCRLGALTVPCPKTNRDGHTCDRCGGAGKRQHRRSVVWGQGAVPCDIMLIGEAPGHFEDLEGLPFRPNAPAGRVLHRAVDATSLQAHRLYVTNVVKCRPPDNRLKDYPDAIVACQDWLMLEIAAAQPRVIVTLGATAGQSVFPGKKAGEMAGMARVVQLHQVTAAEPGLLRIAIIGAYHPSYVARGTDPTAWGSLVQSFKRAGELVREVG